MFMPVFRFSANCRPERRVLIACLRTSSVLRIRPGHHFDSPGGKLGVMIYRSFFAVLACVAISLPLSAQLSKDAKYEILRTVVADQAAARIGLPFGSDGIELTDSGQINNDKLSKDIRKNGQSIAPGKVVTVTAVSFGDDSIDIELDGGGKNKKGILDRIQVGMGTSGTTVPINKDDKTAQAKGSKIVVKFAKKVPSDLTPD